MSIIVQSMVWQRFNVSNGELLLALALADFADDDGETIFPSVSTLCSKTRQSERTVRRQLAYFREIGWLQVVSPAGIFGGRGKTTEYRINPEWIKGANLAGFPDANAEEKGANLAGFTPETPVDSLAPNVDNSEKGCHPRHERVPNEARNPVTGGTQSIITIKNPGAAESRAIPTGSRSAAEVEADVPRGTLPKGRPKDYDEVSRMTFWYSTFLNGCIADAMLFEKAPWGTTGLDALPREMRTEIARRSHEVARWAVTAEIEGKHGPFINGYVSSAIRETMRPYRPLTVAERAAEAKALGG